MTSVQSSPAAIKKTTKHLWLCDFCKLCDFPTMEEACEHETVCEANPENQRMAQQRQTSEKKERVEPNNGASSAAKKDDDNSATPTVPSNRSSNSTNNKPPKPPAERTTKPIHAFFQAGGAAKKKAAEEKESSTTTAKKPPPARKKAQPKPDGAASNKSSSERETLPVDTWVSSRPPRACKKPTTGTDASSTAETPASAAPKKAKGSTSIAASRPKRSAAAATKQKDNRLDSDEEPVTKKSTTTRRSKKPKSSSSSDGSKLAPIFTGSAQDAKAILAEQRALEFFAKRRQNEQQEREKRERKRLRLEQEKQQQLAAGTKKSFTIKTTTAAADSNKAKSSWPVMNFPNPSHVFPAAEKTAGVVYEKSLKARAPTALDVTVADEATYPHLFPADKSASQLVESLREEQADDVLRQTLMKKIFVVPALTNKEEASNNDHQLWVDLYLRNSDDADIVGGCMQAAQQKLTAFIERFMVERQQAEERMAAKQQKMHGKKQAQKKKRKKDYDDDDEYIWADSDDEAEEEPSLCVLTGPVGCGKSQLVHTVAKQMGCRKVLELHTGVKRGAAAMKRCIEEATKSHSTLDMLHNKKQKNAAAAAFFQKRQELVDSESENEEDQEAKGASVTVILLDEVENMYEDHGDNGFWSTLSDLCKRTRCPIILTANSFPKNLNSTSFKCEHIEAGPPTKSECARKLIDVAKAERLSLRVSDDCAIENLELLAALGSCDPRRLVHELQMFASSPAPAESCELEEENQPALEEPWNHDSTLTARQPPLVQSVNPVGVRSDTYSLLTISGCNFLSIATQETDTKGSPCRVFIGDQECPEARIMNDTTILAVCSPCCLPRNVTKSGLNRGSHQRNKSAAHERITVCGTRRDGLFSSSACSVTVLDAPDGKKTLSSKEIVSLEYQFPGHITHYFFAKESDYGSASDDKCEFSDEASHPESRNKPTTTQIAPSQPSSADQSQASKLIQEGIGAWLSVHESKISPEMDPLAKYEPMDLDRIEKLSSECCLLSDAAILEDIGSSGLPLLSGACAGFGFNMTDVFPKHTNENCKRPLEETLILSGWKDNAYFYGDNDSYVTRPTTAREHNMLKASEKAARGVISFSLSQNLEEEENEQTMSSSFSSEEDMLLPNAVPESVKALPTYLKSACLNVAPISPLDVSLSQRSRDAKINQMKGLVCRFVFAGAHQRRMYFWSMTHGADPLLGGAGHANSQFFLDYLPILRCISVQERGLEAALKTAQEIDPDGVAQMTNRKRSTRQNQKKGRVHYLEQLAPQSIWEDFEFSPKEVGDFLADASLLYEP